MSWIAVAQKTVTYCIDPDWLPYEGIENGQHVGISSDYIKLLEDISGYHFLLIPTHSWPESLELAHSKRCQLIPMLNQTEERDTFLLFSKAYFFSPKVLVSKKNLSLAQGLDDPNVKTVAVISGYRTIEYLNNAHPNLKQIVVTSEKEGLMAVSEGLVDVFVGSTLSVNNELFKNGLDNLKITGLPELEDELRMGVAFGEEELLRVIDESLTQITIHQHADIFNKWNKIQVIDNTNYGLIWKIMAVSIAMLSLLLAGFVSARKYNKKLQSKNTELLHLQKELEISNEELRIQSSRDALTSLYNRHYINQIIENPTHQYASVAPMALIVLDLDFFKNINDTFGHTAGDKVLLEVSRLLKRHTDETHILARWGGEEFVIFCKQQNLEDAHRLCERLQESMRNFSFSYVEKLSCSFGVAELLPGESLVNCFTRADAAMYQAKTNGRDRIEQA
ncbi:diguanylate cyclase [Marinicella sp. W31]|uniref:diguanylate cyclase n=1 Tax=Marinicella sp. W31 TaxID=3023713 RepID=UPI0037569467